MLTKICNSIFTLFQAFRILHPGVLQTHFVLEQHGREEIRIPDSFFVKITEINDRAPAVSSKKIKKVWPTDLMIHTN